MGIFAGQPVSLNFGTADSRPITGSIDIHVNVKTLPRFHSPSSVRAFGAEIAAYVSGYLKLDSGGQIIEW